MAEDARRLTAGDYFASGWYAAVGAFFAFNAFDNGVAAWPALAGVAYALLGPASVVLARADKPKDWGTVSGLVVALFASAAFLAGVGAWFFGTGRTTTLALAAVGAGVIAVTRHKRVFDAKRAPRLVGAALVLGAYGALAWGGHRVVTNIVDAPNLNTLLLAVYALVGVKMVLSFAARSASDDAPDAPPSFRGWLRANGMTLGAVLAVLALYTVARGPFAARVPFFPLLEFGLGVALFGFVVAWVRQRVKRTLAEAPVASEWRAHAPRVEVVRDPDFEAVHGPVRAFVDTGGATKEYATAVARAARLPDGDAARVLAPVAAYRRPWPEPPLPFPWHASATATSMAGLGLAFVLLVTGLFGAPGDVTGPFLVMAVGLAFYRLQDDLRKRARPWLALAPAALGVALVGLGVVVFLGTIIGRGFSDVPPTVWRVVGVVALALLVVPALASWRQHRKLAAGSAPLVIVEDPDTTLRDGIAKSRGRVTTLLTVTLVLTFLVPPTLAWLATNAVLGGIHVVPPGFDAFYGKLVPALAAALGGLALAHAVRAVGLTRARTVVVERAARERAERLALHRSVMRALADAVGR